MAEQEDYSVAYSAPNESFVEDEFLYGKSDASAGLEENAQAPKDQELFGTESMEPPSDALPSNGAVNEEPREEDEEEDSDEEGVQIVLNAEAVQSQESTGGGFARRVIFSRPQPNQQQRPGQQTPNAPSFQRPLQPSFQSPVTAQLPGSKGAFDIDIDGLEEKPWRKPGADITDYFNYGFNEETWKSYCQKQVTLRLEQSMQGKIKVFSSEPQNVSELPPELLALTGGGDQNGGRPRMKQERPPSAQKGPPSKSPNVGGPSNDWSRPPEHRRRQREQDDSVIQVLASGDDGAEGGRSESPHSREGSPRSPRGPFGMGMPIAGRFLPMIPGMPGMPRPPYERDFRRDERPRSPRPYREERPPFPEREFEERRERERERHREEPPRADPRDRRREERPRERDEKPREREEKPREERPRERSRESERPPTRDDRSREDPSRKRPIKREEVDDRSKRSRH